MSAADSLDRGREAFDERDWAEAFVKLSAADREHVLDPVELEQLAMAAYLVGEDADAVDGWTRAHNERLSRGEVEEAARCVFWLTFVFLNRGKPARASGWGARGRRLLDEAQRDCVERGYLLLPAAFERLANGDPVGAYETFSLAGDVGRRFDEPDLLALARHSRGRLLIRMGRTDEGVRLLDEAMAAVDAGGLSPAIVGVVYCSVIEGCLEIYDLWRAQEWTEALARWCASQPGIVTYRGECQVRRAEILRVRGAWDEAADAARRACDWLLQGPPQPAAGAAWYQRAELHRLRGEYAEAEDAYREASRWGGNPQPGLAQLRLHQGRIADAEMALRRAMDEAADRPTRCRLLPAYVDIMLAAGDDEAAQAGADELTAMAEEIGTPFLSAVAGYGRGAVLLRRGEAAAALPVLRRALAAWRDIDAPREAARTRLLIGRACEQCGDADTAALEFDAARRVFEQLGADPDLARLEEPTEPPLPERAARLTERETEVLHLVAEGRTNREIADELFVSEKTVARHVSNLLAKLECPNRVAATAYAHRQGLV